MTAEETTSEARKSSNGPTTDNPIPSGGLLGGGSRRC